MGNQPVRSRAVLTGISSRAWEHPADRGALVALRKLRGFDTVLKTVSGMLSERALRLVYLGTAVRVDDRQFPRLHWILADAARTLDVEELPELFVRADPVLNAVTVGMRTPFIVLNSGLVDLLDDEELRFVIGHELGHALSGHATYSTLLQQLIGLSGVLNAIPVGGLAVRGIVAALHEWARKAELSADRAGLLVAQDPAVGLRVHMQAASGGHLADLDPTSFLAQGQEYQKTNLRDSVLKLLMVENTTHPFAVVRAAELRRWIDSGEYTRMVSGGYPRRSDDADAAMSDAAKEAARSYGESFRSSQDTISRFVTDVGGVVGSMKVWAEEKLRRREG